MIHFLCWSYFVMHVCSPYGVINLNAPYMINGRWKQHPEKFQNDTIGDNKRCHNHGIIVVVNIWGVDKNDHSIQSGFACPIWLWQQCRTIDKHILTIKYLYKYIQGTRSCDNCNWGSLCINGAQTTIQTSRESDSIDLYSKYKLEKLLRIFILTEEQT